MFLILVFGKHTLKNLEAKEHGFCKLFSNASEITICIREREWENEYGKMIIAESVEGYTGIFCKIFKTFLCFKLFWNKKLKRSKGMVNAKLLGGRGGQRLGEGGTQVDTTGLCSSS